jgi:dTDP-glucose 4,6-dehydratase
MKKIVYVTGALGFIGSYVTRECLNEGWYVCGVDKITYAARPELIEEFSSAYKNNFTFIQKDINDLQFLYDCDYIINTAAETHVDNSIVSSEEFIHSNINGVHHLLELVKTKNRFKMPVFLHFSTDEVYGDIVTGSHKETDILKPSNPYSATKAAADMLILAWHRTYNVPYVIVRPTNNYGIGQYAEKLIPKTCKFLQIGRKIPLHNRGTPKRVWLNAKDTAKAVVKIIKSETENEIYNISGNYETENIEVVGKVVRLLFGDGVDVNQYCDFSYTREGQDARYSLDDSKIRSLGWEPKCIFDNELPSIVSYYKDNFIW